MLRLLGRPFIGEALRRQHRIQQHRITMTEEVQIFTGCQFIQGSPVHAAAVPAFPVAHLRKCSSIHQHLINFIRGIHWPTITMLHVLWQNYAVDRLP